MQYYQVKSQYEKLINCPAWFELVEIPKNEIYFFFGARFA